jgi:pSer/pThr/pTyr-binding forkhead associated (FHA) protein
MPTLLISSGPLSGRRLRVGTTMVIGREADLSIEDPEVSRVHARLTLVPEGVDVEDLGSTNGTFVNGQRVMTARLRARDELRVGTTTLVLEQNDPSTVPAALRSSPAAAPAARPPDLASVAAFTQAPRRRRVDSRQTWPTAMTFIVIGATAVALLLYFGLRS